MGLKKTKIKKSMSGSKGTRAFRRQQWRHSSPHTTRGLARAAAGAAAIAATVVAAVRREGLPCWPAVCWCAGRRGTERMPAASLASRPAERARAPVQSSQPGKAGSRP